MYLIQGELSSALPYRLFMPDGTTRTSLYELSDEQLAELNIYPVKEVKTELLSTQYYGEPVVSISKSGAVAEYPVVDYTEKEIAEMLVVAKEAKISEISNAFDKYISGKVAISLGWDMQFNQRDIIMVDGVIRYLETINAKEGYLTDWENINHYNLSIDQMKQALLEMTGSYIQAHAYKQQLKDKIKDISSLKDVNNISWELL